MTKKIFRSILLAAAAVLLANLVTVMGCLYGYFKTARERQMRDELRLAACAVEESGRAYLERLRDSPGARPPDCRLTWIASDGTVLFDTAEPAGDMENHGDRVEVLEAQAKGESSSVRYSHTLTEQTLYCARALDGGTVLRLSVRFVTAPALMAAVLQPVLLVAAFAAVLSAVLAHRMSNKIVRPLNALDLDRPLENDTYEELAPLLRRIHQQRRQISGQLRSLREKTDEFTQITNHMNEGLVLLDNTGKILSINPAAQRIFETDASCGGRDFLLLDRGHAMSGALLAAAEHGHGEARLTRGGREYQFDVSRIQSDGADIGTVLLAFDVTEQVCAERNRREFTANVSHELKTPLQSILGSAELLKNGLVRQEDIPHFSGLIHGEAARLVALVEDIIHLSQLDEGVAPALERVDLLELAEEAARALTAGAEEKHVRLLAGGESAPVLGARGLLYEMIYNLCENAIKYNVENGSVELRAANGGQGPSITVRDTGIGIPPEYQSRVFERFFRADKSRSKASGGTGLGLSIVKHIAQYHHAAVALRSQPGEGTVVSVVFPRTEEP